MVFQSARTDKGVAEFIVAKGGESGAKDRPSRCMNIRWSHDPCSVGIGAEERQRNGFENGDGSVDWKEIHIDGIAIERVVAEFVLWHIGVIPGAKSKVKITEQSDGTYKGYTNITVRDALGEFYCAIGFGESIEQALEDTVRQLIKQVEQIGREPSDEDFDWIDPRDF